MANDFEHIAQSIDYFCDDVIGRKPSKENNEFLVGAIDDILESQDWQEILSLVDIPTRLKLLELGQELEEYADRLAGSKQIYESLPSEWMLYAKLIRTLSRPLLADKANERRQSPPQAIVGNLTDSQEAIAKAIEKWRLAVEQVLQTLDSLASYSSLHLVNGITYFPELENDTQELRQKRFADLLRNRNEIAKQLQDGADVLFSRLAEWRELQVEIMPRLMLARNELTKLRGQGTYQFLWAKLSPVAYMVRRWAMEYSWEWLSENLADDVESQRTFDEKRESCPWSDALSREFREHYRDEHSQLLRDLGTHPPLVLSNGKSGKSRSDNQRGRRPEYSPEQCERVKKWWDAFRKCGVIKGFTRNPSFRKGSIDHFIEWGEFQKLDGFPKTAAEVKGSLRSLRHQQSKQCNSNSTKSKRRKTR